MDPSILKGSSEALGSTSRFSCSVVHPGGPESGGNFLQSRGITEGSTKESSNHPIFWRFLVVILRNSEGDFLEILEIREVFAVMMEWTWWRGCWPFFHWGQNLSLKVMGGDSGEMKTKSGDIDIFVFGERLRKEAPEMDWVAQSYSYFSFHHIITIYYDRDCGIVVMITIILSTSCCVCVHCFFALVWLFMVYYFLHMLH